MNLEEHLIKRFENVKKEFEAACKKIDIAIKSTKSSLANEVQEDLLALYNLRVYEKLVSTREKINVIANFIERTNLQIGVPEGYGSLNNYLIGEDA